jgi:hypothetical protein
VYAAAGEAFSENHDKSRITGWTWTWEATYVVDDGERKQRFHDWSVLRAFTPDELRLFLALTGFEALRLTRQAATILTVARKPTSKD